MLTKQKEKLEIEDKLKQERKKLKSLENFLSKSSEISNRTQENSAKAQNLLKRFEEELNPIIKTSMDLKEKLISTDQAVKLAKSNFEYLQNVKQVERRLNQKLIKEEIDTYYQSIQKSIYILEFTSKEEKNDYYQELSQKISKGLEFARTQLNSLFLEMLREMKYTNESDLNVFRKIEECYKIMKKDDHINLFLQNSKLILSSNTKVILSMCPSKSEKYFSNLYQIRTYIKNSHPTINGLKDLIENFKINKKFIFSIFSSKNSKYVFDQDTDLVYEQFVELIAAICDIKTGFTNEFQFFAGLDFTLAFFELRDQIRELAEEDKYEDFNDLISKLASNFKIFIKDYSEILIQSNSKPENEDISHITYKVVKMINEVKNYDKILSLLNLNSEIYLGILKGYISRLEMNRNGFKSKNPILPFLYYLNNLFYILEFSRNKDSEVAFDFESGQIIEKNYEKICSEYIKTIFPDLSQTLATDVTLTYEKDGKLHKSSKKIIKKRFTDFNNRITEFQKFHKDIWLLNKDHEAYLQKFIKKNLVAKYQNFYNTYSDLKFTKKVKDYAKYSTIDLAELIEEKIKSTKEKA